MSHRTASAAELQRKITQHLPVFARPMVDALLERVRADGDRHAAELRRENEELRQRLADTQTQTR